MKNIFILNECVQLENNYIKTLIEEVDNNTYTIQAETTDIANIIEYQLKKQSKKYTKVVTGGVLFAPQIVESNSEKVVYFEFDGTNLIAFGENGCTQTIDNESVLIQILSKLQKNSPKIFFKAELLDRIELVLENVYDSIEFIHIPEEDIFELHAKNNHENEAIKRVLDGCGLYYNEIHYGNTYSIPNVYESSLDRVIYFTLGENGEYIPLYISLKDEEVLREDKAFLKHFNI